MLSLSRLTTSIISRRKASGSRASRRSPSGGSLVGVRALNRFYTLRADDFRLKSNITKNSLSIAGRGPVVANCRALGLFFGRIKWGI